MGGLQGFLNQLYVFVALSGLLLAMWGFIITPRESKDSPDVLIYANQTVMTR